MRSTSEGLGALGTGLAYLQDIHINSSGTVTRQSPTLTQVSDLLSKPYT